MTKVPMAAGETRLPLSLRRLGGFFIILLFYFAGGAISRWTGHIVPGSVIGMLMLFFFLAIGILPSDWVRPAADLLTSTMALYFIPAGVGIMAYWNVLSDNLAIIVAASVISTVCVIATVGWIQERFERRAPR